MAIEFRMSLMHTLVLSYIILNTNWAIKGNEAYSRIEISSQGNSDAGASNFGRHLAEEKTVELTGI